MLQKGFILLVISSAIVLCGCESIDNNVNQLDENAPRQDIQARLIPTERSVGVSPSTQIDIPTGVINLRDAVAFALVRNPNLNAYSLEVKAAEARNLQASLLPNPEIEVEVEEFGGTGGRTRFDSSQTTVQIGQLIELAGKRNKRTNLATLEKDVVEWDYKSKGLDVKNEVTKRFIDLLAAQEQLDRTKELVRLSEQAHLAVIQKVTAGKDSPVDETKAKVVLSIARIESERANKTLVSACHHLAATWGSLNPTFEKAEGNFYELFPVPTFEELTGLISQNPDVARWVVEKERRCAALELEKAKATSDIRLGGGLQYFNEGDDSAFILGLSIPIPLFDRNQGSIDEAMYMLAKTQEYHKAIEINTLAALAETVMELSSTINEITVLKNDVLPSAQSAFDAASQGYNEGKFEYLDVLDAQRTFFEARGKYIEALTKYHKARADVERLIAQSLDGVNNPLEAKAEKSK